MYNVARSTAGRTRPINRLGSTSSLQVSPMCWLHGFRIMDLLMTVCFTAANPVNVGGKLLTADGVDSEDREKLHKN